MISLTSFGQTLDDFINDFTKAIDKNFNEEKLDEMFSKYSLILTPHSDVTQLTASIKGERINQYPLDEFKNENLYKQNIQNLLNSKNSNQRILAYLVISSAGDTTFESNLLEKLKTEKEKGNLIWAAMALMHLKTTYTTPLFDFLVENETFGDAHMLPLFIQLDKDSLQQTAYQRIYSSNPTSRVLAAQILSVTGLNQKTEELLKEAVRNWDFNLKGYAIYSIKELQIGNLLETFKPLLDSSQTKRIALEALANSPSDDDRLFLHILAEKQDTVPEEILDCFFQSKRIDNVKYWLDLISLKPTPKKYLFFVFKQPLLSSDELLIDLQKSFEKIKNPEIIHELVRALRGRIDDKSVEIMIRLLKHDDSSVRYWAAWSLKDNNSPLLIKELPDLLINPTIRTVALVELAIQNNLDTLQNIFESIYSDNPNRDWKRSSIEYLSSFPIEKHKVIFKSILEDENEDTFIKRNAAFGLGRLQEKESVDLIIKVSRQEAATSDFNVRPFLTALSMIKGDKAKAEIERYKNSKEQTVRDLANDLLEKW